MEDLRRRTPGMDVPSLETPEGLFEYIIAGILVLAALFGLVFVVVGSVPL